MIDDAGEGQMAHYNWHKYRVKGIVSFYRDDNDHNPCHEKEGHVCPRVYRLLDKGVI